MQSGTIAIVLAAAVAHAVWNLASKYKREDTLVFVWAYSCVSTLLCVPIGIAQMAKGQQTIDWQLAVGAAVSAALHIVYSLTLQAGYDRAELGVVYPVARGTGPLLTILFAMLFMGERLTPVAMLGACLVVAGIFVVTGHPATHGRAPFKGMLWGVATGAAIAGYTLWDGYSVTTLHLAPVSYYASTLLLQSLIMTPSALRRGHRIRAAIRVDAVPILIVAVFSPLAYVLVLTAMLSAPLALVAPLRESSIIIGSLLAYWLFREDHLARRIAGAVVVLAGIAAISL
ncbi:DMT family transporter [Burkholderia multivorans]|jgi:drug/metabolite transporter (DMT)-like permease|uniref:DMT family transporter n=1 Tax=Burkholderia multivorans TaxID=87883 RepID=A0AAP2MQC5_9BURK|nr:DMT family transporter [Burkholderia multivorans]MBU9357873.1 DMT family transporter [Burkholderia multivorans]MBU9361973.1 DMT family transporter [Burkholderia multivorans]MBU9593800.1 DMT family transporter [Burkholderia multivorans]MCA8454111.1 DMT family transporter [Burkholderia multivorans]MCA8483941.1 DMT family transporter [Burkholderia multivorans]